MDVRTPIKMTCMLLAALLAVFISSVVSAEDHGTAILTSPGDNMVVWRSAPEDDAPGHMLYFQGLQVRCLSDPLQDWVEVDFGIQTGFVSKDNLLVGQSAEEGAPFLPVMVMANKSHGAWLNLRAQRSLDSSVLGKYVDGDLVTVYGVSKDGEWAHVGTEDGKQGFMVPFYLWNHSPLTQHFVSERVYERSLHMERGLEARGFVGENFANDTFIAEVYLTFDSGYTTNDDIVGFNLYINDTMVVRLNPVLNPENPETAPIIFAAAFPFHDAIDKVHLVAVLEEAGENPEETLLLYKRKDKKGA